MGTRKSTHTRIQGHCSGVRTITSSDIERAIIRTWAPEKTLIVPNVSYGFVRWGEIDMLKVEQSRYLTEIEIKVSLSDLKREWKKMRWAPVYQDGFRKTIRRYYIAMPEGLYETGRAVIPDWVGAGILTVRPVEEINGRLTRPYAYEKQKPRINKESKKITIEDLATLGRLGTLRYWSLRRR